jgi:hypothetical protein
MVLTDTHSKAQVSASLGIDEEQCRNCRDDLNGAVAERGIQSFDLRVARIDKDTGAIERDDCVVLGFSASDKNTGNSLLIPHICCASITVEAP